MKAPLTEASYMSVLFRKHDRHHAAGFFGIGRIFRMSFQLAIVIDPMKRDGTESCPLSMIT